MTLTRWLLALLSLLGAQAALAAGPVQYRLDPVHTRVMFAVSHAGFSNAIGTVSGSTGTLLFDPDDWSSAKLEVSVPLDRIDLGDEKWNKAAMANRLLDVKDHPQATFVSTRIEPIDAQRASVYGTLRLHGVSKEVKLDVTLNALKRHPMPPFRRTAGFSATTTLDRMDFGIDAWKAVIGDTVELRIEAEAVRDRGGAEEEPAIDAPPPEDATEPDEAQAPPVTPETEPVTTP
ncbi:YceI family protein [Luteimonas sp. SX5]|uniref:YceI family protein n=1 Tax=Luteimonas galliterrae TaxID=2940486 RepID=A0ABT0MK81_9GAMM|nr:YceI family protein [Luteimonas galliterrae]MCL1635289.1 YceI family protein [Luteimonas galliterrae]